MVYSYPMSPRPSWRLAAKTILILSVSTCIFAQSDVRGTGSTEEDPVGSFIMQGLGQSTTAMSPSGASGAPQLQFTPASNYTFNTSTSASPTRTAYNGSDECAAGIENWWYKYLAVSTETVTRTSSIFGAATEYPEGEIFTLCDGVPRGRGTPTVTDQFISTSTYRMPIRHGTMPSNAAAAAPACNLDESQCSSAYCTAWNDLYYYLSLGVTPTATGCSGPFPTSCPDPMVEACKARLEVVKSEGYTTDPTDGSPICKLRGNRVELIYFPETTSKILCPGNATAITAGAVNATKTFPGRQAASIPQTAEAFGTTFTAGTAYLSFDWLFATDHCGLQTGTRMSNFIMPVPSTALHSICAVTTTDRITITTVPVTFADLASPVPLSAYQCQDRCFLNEENCNTVYDDLAPILAIPADARNLQKEWALCDIKVHEGQNGDGSGFMYSPDDFIFDPPRALSIVSPTVVTDGPGPTVTLTESPGAIPPPPGPEPTGGSGGGGDPGSGGGGIDPGDGGSGGGGESGNGGSGSGDPGNSDPGEGGAGNENPGNGGSGNEGSGDGNSGGGTSGGGNSGGGNSGSGDSSGGNSGGGNSGGGSSGSGDSGGSNSGNGNSGGGSSGSGDSGGGNSGSGNSGGGNSSGSSGSGSSASGDSGSGSSGNSGSGDSANGSGNSDSSSGTSGGSSDSGESNSGDQGSNDSNTGSGGAQGSGQQQGGSEGSSQGSSGGGSQGTSSGGQSGDSASGSNGGQGSATSNDPQSGSAVGANVVGILGGGSASTDPSSDDPASGGDSEPTQTITTVNGEAITVDTLNEGVVIGDNILVEGQTTRIDGTPVSVGSGFIVVDGTSTIFFPTSPPCSTLAIINGQPIAVDALNDGIVIGDSVLVNGQATTIDGTAVSVGSGFVVVDGTSTITYPTDPPASSNGQSEAIFTIDGRVYTAKPNSPVIIGSMTLSAGGLAETLHGHVVSIAPDGVVVDGSTTSFSSAGGATGTSGPGTLTGTATRTSAAGGVVTDSSTADPHGTEKPGLQPPPTGSAEGRSVTMAWQFAVAAGVMIACVVGVGFS
ncbi:hypothetical protein K402DRAFT_43090 [Aulographum hederae CBS 113979]|uniref:Uncharacterized protein n=1 Tax=Aulographum hederae CBS 113979 TaxID=1176131 RepID=A0A6G1H342_9PEZI|nr:hypothetical protein K402DRAFT_43090 [Aulographum hederae CBS 113979]